MSDPVLFHTLPTTNGQHIGVATLNRPDTLNGLSLDMCEALLKQLETWQVQDDIALVLLQGAGERAFSAGGDLHGLHKHMQENTGSAWDNHYARTFFKVEYTLDYLIHTYKKPILAWCSGIVMGGGVGLMAGASHRVITETTRFAMPEVAIGLFPDVGGTWLMGRLPRPVARFLAMTGAHLNASDTLVLGLADYLVQSSSKDALLVDLQAQAWAGDANADAARLSGLIEAHRPAQPLADGPLHIHAQRIHYIGATSDFTVLCERIAALASDEDAWLQRAAKGMLAGAPGSVRLSHELQERARTLSLADVFRMEYIVSLQCGVHGDFQEGIRALLIDKDKTPKWNPASLAQADKLWVERFFVAPWPADQAHPLADLGQ